MCHSTHSTRPRMMQHGGGDYGGVVYHPRRGLVPTVFFIYCTFFLSGKDSGPSEATGARLRLFLEVSVQAILQNSQIESIDRIEKMFFSDFSHYKSLTYKKL